MINLYSAGKENPTVDYRLLREMREVEEGPLLFYCEQNLDTISILS